MTDYLFLAVGGFLLGAFLYSGYYTTKYEPEVKPGYLITGFGVMVVVLINTYIDFIREHVSDWYRSGTMIGYLFVALGLILINRERRGSR